MKLEDMIKEIRKKHSKCKNVYTGTRLFTDGHLEVNEEGSKEFTKNIERIRELLETVKLLLEENE